MLTGGATFKEIADVLGHASIRTTAIYAKVDIAALSRVSMQWPENAP
jgi:integrase/recombinase XerD